ncbi:MAG TPA: bifunctional diaminohydroxyphosphoribosylaminopyrimidine deaminase/5-amino-6-(5-phosphoribosylamino)uracil reductase RibD [Bacteroidales bacterium]|nr:bifunctional diaminohydroxyphosphoribosylaminopyrimidine deaminase/5-amino-6-(5-phosphoribosylamino)uracil reductase RibD [Bacteroidales bacterium]
MAADDNDKFMRRCLELASCAEGMTYPNPLVGAVVVHDGLIIGEGYHQRSGLPHAEVNAINSVQDRNRLNESTLYVNLEPCSHFGKTPPCADFIIASSIPRVVVGTPDTSSKVSGAGIKKLKEAGISVVTGILEEKSRWINRRFFTFNEKRRPWIVLKWAMSSDGFIDIAREPGFDAGPTWISGKPERVLVHRWRSFEQSILVGAGTVRTDNPRLNVREWKGHDPLVLILSRSGKISPVSVAGNIIVFSHNSEVTVPLATVVRLNMEEQSCFQIVKYLYNAGVQSVFIEGGAGVLNHFIMNNLWDEARIFTGKKQFGKGVKAPEHGGTMISEQEFEGSCLRIYSNVQK